MSNSNEQSSTLRNELLNQNDLKVFNAIFNFVSVLNDSFGTQLKKVSLYHHLLSKTSITHKSAITKHFNAFKKFFEHTPDLLGSITGKISYSERVELEIPDILERCDEENKQIIIQHLLLIKTLILGTPFPHELQVIKDNSEDAPNVQSCDLAPLGALGPQALSQRVRSPNVSLRSPNVSNEEKFVSGLMEKIQNNIKPEETKDPMMAINNIMTSGLFQDIIKTMDNSVSNGDIDINKLMMTVTTMMGSLK